MLDLSSDPEGRIFQFVRNWFKLLAAGRLEEACALIDESNCYGRRWTPQLILEVLHDTFSPDTIFYEFHPEGPVFTDPDEVEESCRATIIDLGDAYGFHLDYDIPLNNEWSDLTAQFEFMQRPSAYAVILHDLHVM
jgi:hypothetical protein